MRRLLRGAIVLSALLTGGGCATTQGVRYVYQDGDFGVVGVPENTDRWPTHYRRQAEKLMETHFPEGHEIVRAEEVVEGSRVLKKEGASTAELTPALPTDLLKIGKLGRSDTRSQADTVKIKECRIIYRRAGTTGPPPDFSEFASLTPSQYVDPNAAARRGEAPPDGKTDAKAAKPRAEENKAEPKDG